MKRLLYYLALPIMLFSNAAVEAYAQEPGVQDTITVIIQAIPVTDIIIQATEVNTKLRERRTHLLTDEMRMEITSRIHFMGSLALEKASKKDTESSYNKKY